MNQIFIWIIILKSKRINNEFKDKIKRNEKKFCKKVRIVKKATCIPSWTLIFDEKGQNQSRLNLTATKFSSIFSKRTILRSGSTDSMVRSKEKTYWIKEKVWIIWQESHISQLHEVKTVKKLLITWTKVQIKI